MNPQPLKRFGVRSSKGFDPWGIGEGDSRPRTHSRHRAYQATSSEWVSGPLPLLGPLPPLGPLPLWGVGIEWGAGPPLGLNTFPLPPCPSSKTRSQPPPFELSGSRGELPEVAPGSAAVAAQGAPAPPRAGRRSTPCLRPARTASPQPPAARRDRGKQTRAAKRSSALINARFLIALRTTSVRRFRTSPSARRGFPGTSPFRGRRPKLFGAGR